MTDNFIFNLYTLNGDHQILFDQTAENYQVYLDLLSIVADVDYENQKIHIKTPLKMDDVIRTKAIEFTNKYKTINKSVNKIEKYFRDIPDGEYFLVFPYCIEDKLVIAKIFYYLECINSGVSEEEFRKGCVDLEEKYKFGFASVLSFYDINTFSTKVQHKFGEQDRNLRVCRYCGRSVKNGASFKEKAHAISESIGNKIFVTNNECDECNERFATTIEKDFFEFIKPYRTVYGAKGKNGVPVLDYKNGVSIEYDNEKNITIIKAHEKPNVENGNLSLKLQCEPLNMMNIYRCLVKYVLAVLEDAELVHFSKTIKWINEIKDDGSVLKLPPVMCLLDNTIFYDQPEMTFYVKKTNNNDLPYMVAELKTCCFVFSYIIPFCSKDATDFGKEENFDNFWKEMKHYHLQNREWKKYYFNKDIKCDFSYNFNISSREVENE